MSDFEKPAENNFDNVCWNEKQYSNIAGPQFEKASYLIGLHNFRGNELVWDLGCADGNVANSIISPNIPLGQIVGIDVNEGMIEQAQFYSNVNIQVKMDFIQGDITKLEKYTNQMINLVSGRKPNVVVSNSVLNYCMRTLEDHKRLLDNLAGVMSSGSVILFSFTGAGNFNEFEDGRREARNDPRFSQYFESYTDPGRYDPNPDEYRKLLLDSGFEPIDVYLCDKERKLKNSKVPRQVFSSREDAAVWVKHSVKSHMKFLQIGQASDDEQLHFARRCIDAYLEAHPENQANDGSIELDNVSLIIRATKK